MAPGACLLAAHPFERGLDTTPMTCKSVDVAQDVCVVATQRSDWESG